MPKKGRRRTGVEPRRKPAPTARRRKVAPKAPASPTTPNPPPSPAAAVTVLLQRAAAGDRSAGADLFAVLYDTLHAQARAEMRGQSPAHTLQPTALAHEAFLKLIKADVDWVNHSHFLAVAARAMRCILVDHARGKSRTKRKTSGGRRVDLDELVLAFEARSFEMLALDEALKRLAKLDERAARVVELRFFGGLDVPGVAEVMEIRPRTVERVWHYARAWLHAELS